MDVNANLDILSCKYYKIYEKISGFICIGNQIYITLKLASYSNLGILLRNTLPRNYFVQIKYSLSLLVVPSVKSKSV